MQNRNIYPYLVKGKASKKDGSCPIYVSIHIDNNQVASFSTKKKVIPKVRTPIKLTTLRRSKLTTCFAGEEKGFTHEMSGV